MSKHPAKRPGLAPSDVRKILKAFDIEVDNRERTVAVLGIRGYYQDSMGAQGKNLTQKHKKITFNVAEKIKSELLNL